MMHILRRRAPRIIIGAVLATLLYSAVGVWVTCHREQRIVRMIRSTDCMHCSFKYCGPKWIPQDYQRGVPLFERIDSIGVWYASMVPGRQPHPREVKDADVQELLSELRGLGHLRDLSLRWLAITDASLVHLKELKGLTQLDLQDTNVTVEGIALLREALPNCRITH
jgi:hypothetical protein